MRHFILLLILMSVSACETTSTAQETVTKELGKGSFSWKWTQGAQGNIEEFRFHCESITGKTFTHTVKPTEARTDAPAVWSVPMRNIFPETGEYSCDIRAWNEAGESKPSNRVTLKIVDSKQ